MLDLVIRDGLVVTPEEVGERDIGIQNGTIATPGTLPREAVQVIEAQGTLCCRAVSSRMPILLFRCPRWAGGSTTQPQKQPAALRPLEG